MHKSHGTGFKHSRVNSRPDRTKRRDLNVSSLMETSQQFHSQKESANNSGGLVSFERIGEVDRINDMFDLSNTHVTLLDRNATGHDFAQSEQSL